MKLSRFARYLKESVPDKPDAIVVVSASDVTGTKELSDKQTRAMGGNPKYGNKLVTTRRAVDCYYLVTQDELDDLLERPVLASSVMQPELTMIGQLEKLDPVIVQATHMTDYGDTESAQFEENVQALMMVFGNMPVYHYRTSYNDHIYRIAERDADKFLFIFGGQWFEVDLDTNYNNPSRRKAVASAEEYGIKYRGWQKQLEFMRGLAAKFYDEHAYDPVEKYLRQKSKRLGMNEGGADVDDLKDKVQELTESVKDLSDLVVKMAGKLGYKAE